MGTQLCVVTFHMRREVACWAIKRMTNFPRGQRADVFQMSAYIAIFVRTRHLLILNRDEWQAEVPSCCLVLSNMMPPEDWQSGAKATELIAHVREECEQFGGLDACVVPAVETVPFVSQIFIALREEARASAAKKL